VPAFKELLFKVGSGYYALNMRLLNNNHHQQIFSVRLYRIYDIGYTPEVLYLTYPLTNPLRIRWAGSHQHLYTTTKFLYVKKFLLNSFVYIRFNLARITLSVNYSDLNLKRYTSIYAHYIVTRDTTLRYSDVSPLILVSGTILLRYVVIQAI